MLFIDKGFALMLVRFDAPSHCAAVGGGAFLGAVNPSGLDI
jgi:hypothetical protein